jgi:hypothetical protein
MVGYYVAPPLTAPGKVFVFLLGKQELIVRRELSRVFS